MFDELKKLFASKGRSEKSAGVEDHVVSIAALLVEAAIADERYTENERDVISRLLVEAFGVDTAEVAAILTEAETRQKEAVDLYTFIRDVKTLTPDEKIVLIESLWRVILSDGEKDAYEDMLVRRVCGLIHVSDVDSGLARRRVQTALSR
ncbi:MAG: TerB family tellurite resistance protein [Parvularculaceae bacterium]|nr:TerB family tellurite resistance protein [Parvularculaceae bacterium]